MPPTSPQETEKEAKEGAKPVLAIFDLDGTLTRRDSYLCYLKKSIRWHPFRLHRYLILPFAVALFFLGIKHNTWLKTVFLKSVFGGFSRQKIDALNERFLNELVENGMTDAGIAQLNWHQSQAHRIILLSASLNFYVEPLAHKLGISEVISTQVEWVNDRLSGKLGGANLKSDEKVNAIKNHLGHQSDVYQVIAYGDHVTDLAILSWADQGVWVKSSSELEALAAKHEIEIRNWHDT